MDPETKLTATRQGVHTKSYKDLVEHIDERYKMTFGHVDFQEKDKKDDPMGIFSLLKGEEPEEQAEYEPHLDAVRKGGHGKGGGWMSNGGKCNTCNGEGRMGRDCPSKRNPDGSLISPDTICHGCNGKGHMIKDCPTASPS